MKRNAFSVVELLVVIIIIGVLIGMLLPAVQRTRGPHLRTDCLNRLRQLALATLNYESANMEFPQATGVAAFGDVGSNNQLNGLVAVLPFLEQSNIYDQITRQSTIDGVDYPAFPPLYGAGVRHWEFRVPSFICPSVNSPAGGKYAPIHYGLCIGDRARNIASPKSLRGGFAGSQSITFDDMADGSSNTILAGEICSREAGGQPTDFAIDQPASILEDPMVCFDLTTGSATNWRYTKAVPLSPLRRGEHWADGRAGVALFNTILPPNSPSAAVKGSVGVDGIYSASGPHPGAINVVFFDGSCHSIDLEIDIGDSSSPTLTEEEMAARVASPYGVWGALGTINGNEVVNDF